MKWQFRQYLVYHAPIWLGTPLFAWLMMLITGTVIPLEAVGVCILGLFILLVLTPVTIDKVQEWRKP